MLRVVPRTVARSAPRRAARPARGYAHHAGHVEELVVGGNPTKEYLANRANIEHHAAETTELWRKISFFVAVPATILATLWVRRVEAEHAEHAEHIKAEHGGEMPAIPDYEYLNKRGKPFPWGRNSLFFNPHVNKNMEDAE